MPEFVSDFIYNFGKVESYNTKLEYCRDIRMFLDFIVNFIPDYAETNVRDLTVGSVVVTRKGGDTQTVYYSDECAEYLQIYFDSQKAKFNLKDANHFPAFTALSGERLGVRAVERLVKKYVKAALPDKAEGSKITPHKLRSSFAMSFYAASGNDILKLQKKLNHKSIATTNVYAKAANTDMEDTRNLLQGLR